MSSKIAETLETSPSQVSELVSRRAEQESYIRRQNANRVLLEQYFMRREEVWARAFRRLKAEDNFNKLQQHEMARARATSRQKIMQLKDGLVEQFAEQIRKTAK